MLIVKHHSDIITHKFLVFKIDFFCLKQFSKYITLWHSLWHSLVTLTSLQILEIFTVKMILGDKDNDTSYSAAIAFKRHGALMFILLFSI